jgi:hypothetical protein
VLLAMVSPHSSECCRLCSGSTLPRIWELLGQVSKHVVQSSILRHVVVQPHPFSVLLGHRALLFVGCWCFQPGHGCHKKALQRATSMHTYVVKACVTWHARPCRRRAVIRDDPACAPSASLRLRARGSGLVNTRPYEIRRVSGQDITAPTSGLGCVPLRINSCPCSGLTIALPAKPSLAECLPARVKHSLQT